MNNEVNGPWEATDFRLVIGRSKIDYDWDKEEENRRKHGYSLESAVHYLDGLLLPLGRPVVVYSDPIVCKGEIRYQHMTIDESDRVVFFVTTVRPDETIRVISLRNASTFEQEIYRKTCMHGEIITPKK